MPRIVFMPSGAQADVPAGTGLLDAALRAGATIQAPCGGKGSCRKCAVRVIRGTPAHHGASSTETDLPEGFVYACRSSVGNSELVIEIPEHDFASDDRFEEPEDCAFFESLHVTAPDDSLTRVLQLALPPPGMDDGISDLERLTGETCRLTDAAHVEVPLNVLRTLPSVIRSESFTVSAIVSQHGDTMHVVDCVPGHGNTPCYAAAIDLGTTSVSVRLVDTASGAIIGTRSGYNSQISCGLDIISRINYAKTAERLDDLRHRACASINRLINSTAGEHGIDPRSITAAVISGNTTMVHLLLGIEPEYLRLEPYAPCVLGVPGLDAQTAGIDINPGARVVFSPAVGSYVGGDITAGLLATGDAFDGDDVCMFIDIGTNGEMVLGNSEFLLSCACSAGPAFEGGGIECGMRATAGAISAISVDESTGDSSFSTIGGHRPKGICGSGIIDLIAELLRKGFLDQSGKIAGDRKITSIMEDGRRTLYIVSPADASHGGAPVILTETDIDNVKRAKAAIYSASSLMLRHVGLGYDDIAGIFVAGGFGRYLNLRNAITIGLLPDLPIERYSYLGNASLTGATALALSKRCREKLDRTARRMTYINLSSDPGYMDCYTAALFLPHTDMGLFPSVAPEIDPRRRL